MCAGAMIHARLDRLVFAAPDPKAGAAGSVLSVLNHPRLNHQMQVEQGILAEEAAELLRRSSANGGTEQVWSAANLVALPPFARPPQRRRPVAGDPAKSKGWGTEVFRPNGVERSAVILQGIIDLRTSSASMHGCAPPALAISRPAPRIAHCDSRRSRSRA